MPPSLPHETKIVKEASITMGGSMVGGLFRYLFNIQVARFLGIEILGLYAIGNAMTQLAVVVGKLGLDGGVLRFVARHQALNETPVAIAAVRRGVKVAFFSSLVIAAVLFLAATVLSTQLFHAEDTLLASLLRWFALVVPVAVVAHVLAGASQGFQVLKHRALALHVFPSLTMVLIFLVLVFWAGTFWSLALAFVGSQVVSLLAAGYYLTRLVPVHRPPAAEAPADLVSYSLAMVLAALAATLMHWSDIIILGALTDSQTTGLYQPAVRTAGILNLAMVSLGGIFAPIVSGLYAQEQQEQIKRLLKLVGRWTFAVTWPAFLFLMLYAAKVMLLFGTEFVAGSTPLRILSVAQVILTLAAGSALVLSMTGYPKINLLNSVLVFGLNIALNLYLIPRYGIMGAAWATTVALGVLALLRIAEVWAIHRMQPLTLKHGKPLLAGILAWAVCWAANRFIFDWHTVVVLLLGAIIFVSVYAAATYVLRLDADDRAILAAVRRKLGGKLL